MGKEKEKEVFNRDMNAHSAIDISKRIVGLFPITSKNIIHFQEENDEDLQMAEKRVACEYISHYLGMGFDPLSIEKTKFGRNNTLYIQLLDKDNALELLKS